MLLKLHNWFTSTFGGLLPLTESKIDSASVAEEVIGQYVIDRGRVWFKLHYPEDATAQDTKRAVLKHTEYCGEIATTAIFGSTVWSTPGTIYTVGDRVITNGTVIYEVVVPKP